MTSSVRILSKPFETGFWALFHDFANFTSVFFLFWAPELPILPSPPIQSIGIDRSPSPMFIPFSRPSSPRASLGLATGCVQRARSRSGRRRSRSRSPGRRRSRAARPPQARCPPPACCCRSAAAATIPLQESRCRGRQPAGACTKGQRPARACNKGPIWFPSAT